MTDMPEQMDDEELQSELAERLVNPPSNAARYDGRINGQVVNAQRTRERKLRALDRRINDLDSRLAAHLDGSKPLAAGDIQVLRLRVEIAEGQRNRIEGKPYIATNPNESKRKDPVFDNRLQMAIQNLIMSPAPQLPPPPKLDEPAPVAAEPEPPKAAMPDSTLRLIADMRERARCSRPF